MTEKNTPIVLFNDIEPLRDRYINPEGEYWYVSRLVNETKDFPVFNIPVAALDISQEIWHGYDMFHLAFHVKKVMEADLSFPIILDWRGRLMDGRHRILKAMVEGKTYIPAVRFNYVFPPCGKEKEND